jgi:hypothetical protein
LYGDIDPVAYQVNGFVLDEDLQSNVGELASELTDYRSTDQTPHGYRNGDSQGALGSLAVDARSQGARPGQERLDLSKEGLTLGGQGQLS